jgi:effector-binding domain-containing protein
MTPWIETRPEVPTAVVATVTTWPEFPGQWKAALDDVWALVRARSLPAGRNVMLYRDDRPSAEIGVELDAPFEPTARVVASTLPGGPTALAAHRGPPGEIGEAHEAVLAWCAANGHELTRVRWEIYGHVRAESPDVLESLVGWQLAR